MNIPINKRKPLTIKAGEYSSDALTALAMGFILGYAPWLAWGPIDNILSALINKLISYLFGKTVVLINSIVIGIDVNIDVSRLEKAFVESAENPSPENDEKIKQAMRKLITIGRSPL